MAVTVEQAIEAYSRGRFVIIIDDESRENEGDLAIAAEHVTADSVNFMATYGRGLICMAVNPERLDELSIAPLPSDSPNPDRPAFAIPVDARHGVTTGISAADRAETIRQIIDPKTKPNDLVRPGHVMVLRGRPGGVLERAGHTEAAIDLARLAGLYPAAVICEVLNPAGTMARLPELEAFSETHNIPLVTVESLIAHRRRTEKLVHRVAETTLPTDYGVFQLITYISDIDERPYLALVKGDPSGDEPVLVRVHSQCLTGDALHSKKCDCGEQLAMAMKMVQEAGRGVVLYIASQEGRGIGLTNKMRAYHLQDLGSDTVEANKLLGLPVDARDYGLGEQVLADLGVRKMRLMTNNPKKIVGLHGYGLEVVERVPLVTRPNESNIRYLQTKRDKLGHLL